MSRNRSLLDNIAIVLVNPKYPENVGSAARAAWNMGLTRIIVVGDEYPDHDRMATLATHNAVHLIDSMEFHENLDDALKPFSQVVATTARRGKHRMPGNTPREIMDILLPLLPENQVAFLFGPEDRGLTNDDLNFCQLRSVIPTDDFSSLNLAQAVAIHCYEIFHALVYDQRDITPAAQIASSQEVEKMFDQVEKSLKQIDFLHEKNHDFYMRNIRQLFNRVRLIPREAQIIRKICRQILEQDKKRKG